MGPPDPAAEPSASPTPSPGASVAPPRLHALSPARVRAVAGALFVAVTALLAATQDAGFTRDESFYFDFAERYQDWHVAIEQATTPAERDRAFGREATQRVWRGNHEHPPLMKELFGLSWRVLARKDRRVAGLREDAGLRFDVLAGPADGFAAGAPVLLLAPQRQGQAQTDADRVLARGLVTARTRDRAQVHVDDDDPDRVAALLARCEAGARERLTPPASLPVTPCMGREVRTLDLMSESDAMRFPGVLAGGLAAMLTFLLGEVLFGWVVGLLGALLFLFVPEHFFHAHLACFDMPIVAAQLFCLYAFWRSLADRRWALVAGLAWGVALLTKHNAFFVPVGLVVIWLWSGRDRLAFHWSGLRRGALQVQLPPLPLAFLTMPLIGLPMLFAFWPNLWYDPLRSVGDWLGFHLEHEHYMQYWFGVPLQAPPFPVSYPFEKTALTYPEVFLALFALGLLFLAAPARWAPWLRGLPRRAPVTATERAGVFALVNGLLPILVIALPSTPIFGGIKHWMPGAPFLALIAAYGFARLAAGLRLPALATALAAVLLVAHPIKASLDSAWLGTNYYNALLAGGLQGAADKQLTRIFWGHEARWACRWLNAHAPRGARVYWQDATWGTYAMYQREGWLRHDIRYHPGPAGADIVLNETLQALWDIDVATRREFDVPGPLWTLDQDGVPYLAVYVRRGLDLPPPAPAP